MNQNFFDNIEKKTGVKMNDVMKLANSLQNSNLKDEKTLRNVIKQVSKLANKPVTKQKEDQIVNAVINNNMPGDINSIMKMFNKK